VILVTHDLGIVAERADEVAIMYAGRIVERAPVEVIFSRPQHPYTRGLLRSIPKIGAERARRLEAIPGLVPDLTRLPNGCHFRDRCPIAIEPCAAIDPPLEPLEAGHWAACIRSRE
jgi:peptide/nickel transport system ATP-binding protein